MSFMGNTSGAVLVSTFGVTLVLLIFGETLPKSIAWRRSEAFAFTVSRPLTLVSIILLPGTKVLHWLSSLCNRLLGISGTLPEAGEEEIRTLIAVGAQSGVVEQNEAELLEKVFRFGDRQIREIMTPRPEIVWLERGTSLERFLSLYSQHSHTRFPVYQDSTGERGGRSVEQGRAASSGAGKAPASGQCDGAYAASLLRPGNEGRG